MPPKRKLHPNAFYHVTIHGHHQLPIFQTLQDKHCFLKILQEVHQKYKYTLISYCIMSNHYHLLIRPNETPLSKIIASINHRYSMSYKRRYLHKGTIYDDRYFSAPLLTSQAILNTSVYIHCNPIHTKVPMVTSLEHYLFSSYPYYYNEDLFPPSFLEVDSLYKHLPSYLPPNFQSYQFFINRPKQIKRLTTRNRTLSYSSQGRFQNKS